MEIATEMRATAYTGDRSEPRRMSVRHANGWSLLCAGAGEIGARTVFMARLAQVYQRVIAARAAVENVPAEDQLARRGCQMDILSECSLLVARAPHTPGAISDDVLLGCERMCAIATYHCAFRPNPATTRSAGLC